MVGESCCIGILFANMATTSFISSPSRIYGASLTVAGID
jgi:hypothetical protein